MKTRPELLKESIIDSTEDLQRIAARLKRNMLDLAEIAEEKVPTQFIEAMDALSTAAAGIVKTLIGE